MMLSWLVYNSLQHLSPFLDTGTALALFQSKEALFQQEIWRKTLIEEQPVHFHIPLTRARPGGGCLDNPIRFLAYLFTHPFHTLCKNFSPRSFKVRSPGPVKWPHVPKNFNLRHSYNSCAINFKTSRDWLEWSYLQNQGLVFVYLFMNSSWTTFVCLFIW